MHRVLVLALLACAFAQPTSSFTYDHGGIVRGDRSRKQLALVFTGGDYADGTESILNTLKAAHVPAGLFVTGKFLSLPGQKELLQRALREGHYVGPHSDQHLLYANWNDRETSIVSRQEFQRDLQRNIDELRRLGALRGHVFFIPPFEWFNRDQARWAGEMKVTLFNFSPGSGSNRDYLPESDPRFVSSKAILDGILDCERKDPDGLNGFILLLHLGADRKDKMYAHLQELVDKLRARGYEFVRIDRLLERAAAQPN